VITQKSKKELEGVLSNFKTNLDKSAKEGLYYLWVNLWTHRAFKANKIALVGLAVFPFMVIV
tara:strand:+ start:232 stop:417 length:186 start_codon:yes stop_codon:yes gene_type:complete